MNPEMGNNNEVSDPSQNGAFARLAEDSTGAIVTEETAHSDREWDNAHKGDDAWRERA